MYRKSLYLFFCILIQFFLRGQTSAPKSKDELARMESKVLASVSLKYLEELVENDDRVRAIEERFSLKDPESLRRVGIIIEGNDEENSGSSSHDAPAYRENPKPTKKSKAKKKATEFFKEVSERDSTDESDEPSSWFPASGPLTEESRLVEQFMESLAERITTKEPKKLADINDFSETRDIPSYSPRFDYDSYSKDPLHVKLNGKSYWRDSTAEPRSDDPECVMVVKNIKDPEDGKKKSVIITKECVHPGGAGSDARLPVVEQVFRPTRQQYQKIYPDDSERFAKKTIHQHESRYIPVYRENVQEHAASPVKVQQRSRDALNSDYIDRMLDEHFKNFPTFRASSSSVKDFEKGLNTEQKNFDTTQEKDGYRIRTYQHEHPSYNPNHRGDGPSSSTPPRHEQPSNTPNHKDDRSSSFTPPRVFTSTPEVRMEGNKKIYDHHHHYYHYPDSKEQSSSSEEADQGRQSYSSEPRDQEDRPHHIGHDHHGKFSAPKSQEEGDSPKMFKKSFAYYRKDNPKDEPDNKEYAEEYAQGNYRSISSSYDSEKDDPKKKKAE